MKLTKTVAVLLLLTLALRGTANAEHTSREEVRRNLYNGGWHIVWGRTITEKEYIEMGSSIYSGQMLSYVKYLAQINYEKMRGQLPGVAQDVFVDWVVQSVRSGRPMVYRGVQVQAGLATYRRWERIVYHEPQTKWVTKKVGFVKTKVPTVVMVKKERIVPWPNHHQPYIRIRPVR